MAAASDEAFAATAPSREIGSVMTKPAMTRPMPYGRARPVQASACVVKRASAHHVHRRKYLNAAAGGARRNAWHLVGGVAQARSGGGAGRGRISRRLSCPATGEKAIDIRGGLSRAAGAHYQKWPSSRARMALAALMAASARHRPSNGREASKCGVIRSCGKLGNLACARRRGRRGRPSRSLCCAAAGRRGHFDCNGVVICISHRGKRKRMSRQAMAIFQHRRHFYCPIDIVRASPGDARGNVMNGRRHGVEQWHFDDSLYSLAASRVGSRAVVRPHQPGECVTSTKYLPGLKVR